MTPIISIIVPIYNTEKYLNECIESITKQSYTNIEIILVNDGSTDSCSIICDKWHQIDARIKVIHKSNGGLSDARNAGIEESKGEYIMFIDSDDFVDVNIVYELYNLQKESEADIVCCGINRYNNGKTKKIYNKIITKDKLEYCGIEQLKNILNFKTDCGVWAKLYKREIIGNHRFIKDRYNEDIIFLFSLYQKCNKVLYTNKAYYYYRYAEGSITHKLSNKTMHFLQNMLEMEVMTIQNKIPIIKEMENYRCRVCLELGYAIQRDSARQRFPIESDYVKRQIKRYLTYIFKQSSYTIKDFIHAIIVLVKL